MTVPSTSHGFLGKLPPKPSPFKEFKEYFEAAVPAPPPGAHYGHQVSAPWNMDGNGPDPEVTIAPPNWPGCGDCVEATKAHALLNADYETHGLSSPVPEPTPNDVVTQYALTEGCTTAQLFSDPDTYDNGEVMSTSLTNWCSTEEYGIKLAFTAPVALSENDIKNGIYLGGGMGLGVQIQQAQEDQFPGEWKWVKGSPTLGGHAIWLTGYNENVVYLVSWGQLISASWDFIMTAADEGHVLMLPQVVAAGKSPSGLSIAAWESDLKSLGS